MGDNECCGIEHVLFCPVLDSALLSFASGTRLSSCLVASLSCIDGSSSELSLLARIGLLPYYVIGTNLARLDIDKLLRDHKKALVHHYRTIGFSLYARHFVFCSLRRKLCSDQLPRDVGMWPLDVGEIMSLVRAASISVS